MYLIKLATKAANLLGLGTTPESPSGEAFILDACPAGRHVLKIGNGDDQVVTDLKRNFCHVTACGFAENQSGAGSTSFAPVLPENVAWFDRILLLDLIEELRDPEDFMETLRGKMARCGSEVIVTASNAGYRAARFISRLAKRGSNGNETANARRRHCFTFKSLCALLERAGYEILEARGVPAPLSPVVNETARGRALMRLNQLLLKASKHLFSDQIYLRVRPIMTARRLFQQPTPATTTLHPQVLGRVA